MPTRRMRRSLPAGRPASIVATGCGAMLAAVLVLAYPTGANSRADPAATTLANTLATSKTNTLAANKTNPTSTHPCGVQQQAPTRWNHVVWIVMENEDASSVLNPAKAPYFNSLGVACGIATGMRGITHPSLPNYIAMTAGTTFGVTDNGLPSEHRLTGTSIFSQLGPTGWRVLSESMPSNCYRRNSGSYAPRHNPSVYYTKIAKACRSRNVPTGSGFNLSAKFTFIQPNNINNMHDSSIATGDTYLSKLLPQLIASRAYQGGDTAIFVTFDESEPSEPANQIATLVISPSTVPGTRDGSRFDHYSLLRTTEQLLGLKALRHAASARSMRRAFNLAN